MLFLNLRSAASKGSFSRNLIVGTYHTPPPVEYNYNVLNFMVFRQLVSAGGPFNAITLPNCTFVSLSGLNM